VKKKAAARKPHKHKASAPRKAAKPAPARKVSPAPKVAPRAKTPVPRARPTQIGGRFAGKPYRASQADYAKRYGKSLPTIKRWWKDGKPLDDPDAMGEYLSDRGRKPAEPVAVLGISFAEDSPGSARRLPLLDEDDGETHVELSEKFFRGEGILCAIERLKQAERERAAAYFSAITQRLGSVVVQNRFKEWVGIIEALRKLAKDEPDIRKANDLTVDKSEVEAAMGHIFNGFRLAARNLPGRATAKLVGLREHEEIIEVLEREVEVLLRALATSALEEATKAAVADEAAEESEATE
jgi:hypothetical protein